MFDIDIRNKTHIYQLIAGICTVTVIIGGCLVILAPFFPAILLAVLLSLSAWPGFKWLNTKLHNRPATAAMITTLLLSAGFIVPLVIIGSSTAENVNTLYTTMQQSLEGDTTGRVAQALDDIPYAGEHLKDFWLGITSDKEKMSDLLKEYGGSASQMLLKLGTSIGRGLLDLTLGVLIAYFFFRYGSNVAERTLNLIHTFGGERGERLLEVSKTTLIGVVYGMMGTALLQGLLGAAGFAIAGVPAATLLGLLTFFVSFIPVGPPVIWIPAAIWLFNIGETTMAIFLVVWGAVVVGSIDNVIRPYFVSRGANLPFILVLLGIIGGMIAFGFIGLFIGPTLLALAYTLILEWSSQQSRTVPQPAADKKPKKKK